MIDDTRADFVALQEVDEDSHWNKNINLLEFIQDHTVFDYSFLGLNNKRKGLLKLNYGNAILSRYPLTYLDNQPFGQATLGEKGFLYAEISLESHVFSVINLHLDFRSRKRRIVQVEQLIDYLKNKRQPEMENGNYAPIICGDFNSHSQRAGDAVHHLFQYILHHGNYTLYPVNTRTFPAHWPRTGIDFIFLPAFYHQKKCSVIKSYLSDHRPVLIEFQL